MDEMVDILIIYVRLLILMGMKNCFKVFARESRVLMITKLNEIYRFVLMKVFA
jgi:hypothetical protein